MQLISQNELVAPAFTGSPLEIAEQLSAYLQETAVERDEKGGTPIAQRNAIRQSGLLKLFIPEHYGGLGGSWVEIFRIIRIIAKADSSVAQVFAFQFLMLVSIRLYGSKHQWESLFEETVSANLWWGNTLNPLDDRTVAIHRDGRLIFNGLKSFCTGATDSDRLIVSAIEEGTGKFLVAAIPTRRSGIHIYNDWNNIGQRQTDSGSVEFKEVVVEYEELLMNPGPLSSPFSSLRSLVAQMVLTNIYLGIAQGAMSEAVDYTKKRSRVWQGSLAESINEDPYTLLHLGEFWSSLEVSRIMVDHAAALLDSAWSKGLNLSAEERGDVALAVFAAKTNITKSGLDVTSRIFEVAGAGATAASLRLDRFWRNLRVYTLHDPVDYKLKDLGNWVLNNKYPTPSFYS